MDLNLPLFPSSQSQTSRLSKLNRAFAVLNSKMPRQIEIIDGIKSIERIAKQCLIFIYTGSQC